MKLYLDFVGCYKTPNRVFLPTTNIYFPHPNQPLTNSATPQPIDTLYILKT